MKLTTSSVAGGALAWIPLFVAACAAVPVSGTAARRDAGLGPGASLAGRRPLPPDNPWNQEVDRAPVDPNSAALVASIGVDAPIHPDFGKIYGIPYVVVTRAQPRVPVVFQYPDESDPGPYPVPPDAPIEGGAASDGDRHVLVIDRDAWKLYELFSSFPQDAGKSWRAGSGAIFDLNSNRQRPAGWTSADAAGLPIFPGLVRWDEAMEQKAIRHALRFTCRRTRHGYVAPARHFASSLTDLNLPPMGMRVRLKASVDIRPFPPPVRVILTCLKQYGMFLADNGSDWFVSGAPDSRWDDEALSAIKRLHGRDLEVVKMGPVVTE